MFDLDGTVYLGERLIPGADEVIRTLRRHGIGVVFLSNKPLESRESYAAKLTRLGIPTDPEDVITSAYVTAEHLARAHPGARVYALGEEVLARILRQAGVVLVPGPGRCDPAEVDLVLASFDRTLTWEKLSFAHQALRRGARLVATNPDPTCPVEGGDVPDAGAIIAALETSSGARLEWVAGKPSELMVQAALQRLGVEAAETALVGDRAQTDMLMARRSGVTGVLVLTGVTTREDTARLPADRRPDYVLSSIAELL
ncbi:HAD-IIA family hydrolase [Carboxydochorda subterranea]|uniref:Acid sugar phosphatase n=1 Tax=Carboxydichorda subterranea TaxID=3109565 RepID=A0ABZ1C207_9FIRM|nr:HAD-IIA family hydrolase [Limnochorda sp. L945t]WRP18992.1 HAD-IIA family hydrolase [Limnochorda sp. L945t]